MALVEFEYKIIEYLGMVTEIAFLNEAGRDGWELCYIQGNRYYFKRVKKDFNFKEVWKNPKDALYAMA